jgi:MscS family membrane protein
MLDQIKNCCDVALGVMDGVYGWLSEAIAIIAFVLIFNFFAKWLLKRLHTRFERQKKIIKDGFVKALYKPLSYFVWFFAIIHAIDLISEHVFQDVPQSYMHMASAVGAILALAWFLMRWKKHVFRYLVTKSKNRQITIDQGKLDVIDKVATVFIAFFTIFILLEVTDRSVNTLIAFGGIGGLALAFASQEIISNFFGGFMIYLTHPFTIGDWIQLPDRNIEGIVEEIGWYMTRIRSLDKRPIHIPNSIFSKIVVITPSRMSHRQIKEVLNLRYEDMPKLKSILSDIKEMLQQHPDVDRNQPISVIFTAFGSYSLDITVKAYTLTIDSQGFTEISEDILFKIANIVQKHGADFAFPTQNMILGSTPGPVAEPQPTTPSS